MLWRKKKTSELPSTGLPGTVGGQSTALTMTEVYALSYAAALKRGYPGAVADAIAGRVLWLERRGLPGVIALTREFLNNKDTAPVERGTNCPFIAGTLLMDQFDLFVGCDPNCQVAIEGPTNGLLILPKVAQYAALIGEAVRISWLKGEPPEVTGAAVVDASGCVAVRGDISAALFNTGIAFVRHGAPIPDAGTPNATKASVPDHVVEPLVSFIGRDRLELAIKVHKLVADDAATVALLHMMSDCERASMLKLVGRKARGDVTVTAAPGSTNQRVFSRLEAYDWTTPGSGTYVVCDEGRTALPMMFAALDRFPPTKH